MAIVDRREFQTWLARYEARHREIHGDGPVSAPGRCDGCGEPLPGRPSPTGLCLVCLAEQFGRDCSRAAARIAGALRVALAEDGGATPISDVREAIDDVLAEAAG